MIGLVELSSLSRPNGFRILWFSSIPRKIWDLFFSFSFAPLFCRSLQMFACLFVCFPDVLQNIVT